FSSLIFPLAGIMYVAWIGCTCMKRSPAITCSILMVHLITAIFILGTLRAGPVMLKIWENRLDFIPTLTNFLGKKNGILCVQQGWSWKLEITTTDGVMKKQWLIGRKISEDRIRSLTGK